MDLGASSPAREGLAQMCVDHAADPGFGADGDLATQSLEDRPGPQLPERHLVSPAAAETHGSTHN